MSFLRDTFLSAFSNVLAVASRFVVTILLARALTPQGYGQFVFLQWVIELTGLICSFGMPGAVARFVPQIAADKLVVRRRAALRVVLGIALACSCLCAAVFFGYLRLFEKIESVDYPLLVAWCLASILLAFMIPYLQGLFRYDAVLAGTVAYALIAPISLLAYGVTADVRSAVLPITIALLCSLVSSSVTAATRRGPVYNHSAAEPATVKDVVKFSINTWITVLLANLVWARGEFAVLKMSTDVRELAIYSAGLSLASIVNQAIGLLTGALMPHLARHWSSQNHGAVDKILRRITQAALMLSSILAILLIAGGKDLVPKIFGSKYSDSYSVLAVLAISAISISSGCANSVLQIATHARFGRNANLVGLCLLLAGSTILTPMFGIIGAAIARAIAQITIGMYIFNELSKWETFRDSSRRFVMALGSAVFLITVYYVIATVFARYSLWVWTSGAALAVALLIVIRLIIGEAVSLVRLRGAALGGGDQA